MEIRAIPLRAIQPNPEQSRSHFDPVKLAELAVSIKARGGVENPIVVTPNGGPESFILVSGERRWRAAKQAGLTTIDAVIKPKKTGLDLATAALLENMHRSDLSAVEEARAFKNLMDAHGLDVLNIAELTGKSASQIYNRLTWLKLENAIQELEVAGRLHGDVKVAQALLKLPAGKPIVMAKTLLFTGPASVGKTHLANLVATVLALPLVKIDGHGVRSREALFGLIDEALDAHGLAPTPGVSRSGIPTFVYPAFIAFVDEVHLVGPGTQQSWLTMLEQDDRSVNLDGKLGRRIALVSQATFMFATTQPSKMDRALRTRCTEIQLQRYTEAEVAQMVQQRFPQLPMSPSYNVVDAIAACSRFVPRVAFEITRDILEEIKTSPTDSAQTCVKRALNGRGILTTGGMTRNDVRYLKVLQREGRPVGERVLRSQLHDVEAQRIGDDIEPYLVAMDYIAFTERGRQLTYAGRRFLQEVAPTLNVE